jgi:predicted RNA binding protein YcfA (HicA-like mRNA interferase family)
MKLPRDIKAEVLIKVFSRYGYSVTRQVGSHVRMSNDDNSHSITIPQHNPVKVGLLHNIVKDFCVANEIDTLDIISKL